MAEPSNSEVSHWLVDIRPQEKRNREAPQARNRRGRGRQEEIKNVIWMINLAEKKHMEVDVSDVFDLGNHGLAMCSHQGQLVVGDLDRQFMLGNPLYKTWDLLPDYEIALQKFRPTIAAISTDSKFLLVSNIFKCTAIFSMEQRTWTLGTHFEPWIAGSEEDRERRMNPSSDPLLTVVGYTVWAANAFYTCMSRRRRSMTCGMQWDEVCLARYDMEKKMWREADEIELPERLMWSEVTEVHPLRSNDKLLVYIQGKSKEKCYMAEYLPGGKLAVCSWFDDMARDKVWSLSDSSLCISVLGEDNTFIWYATDTGLVIWFCLESKTWTDFVCTFHAGPCYLRTFGTWKVNKDSIADEINPAVSRPSSSRTHESSRDSPVKNEAQTSGVKFCCCSARIRRKVK